MSPGIKTIFVDVDGTLVDCYGNSNQKLIAWIRAHKEQGFEFNLWSMRGKAHALETAQRLGVADLFDAIISKPSFIVDDAAWGWIRFTRCIFFDEIESGESLT